MKFIKSILIIALVALIVIQFFPVDYNETTDPQPNDISAVVDVPAPVHELLKTSCYDCHSNNTQYPWYNKVQPVAWFLEDHVKEGKSHLNFNEFGTYEVSKQKHKLDELVHEVGDGKMPLDDYLLMHSEAELGADERQLLVDWANDLWEKL